MPRNPRIRASIAGMTDAVSGASAEGANAAAWASHFLSYATEMLKAVHEDGVTVELEGIELPKFLRAVLGLEEGEHLKLRIRIAEEEVSDEVQTSVAESGQGGIVG